MKKKLVSILLSAAMATTLLAGCGGSAEPAADAGTQTEETADAVEETADAVEEAVEETPTATFGDSSGTHLEMWTFVHGIGSMIATSSYDWDLDLASQTLTDAYQGLKHRFEQMKTEA